MVTSRAKAVEATKQSSAYNNTRGIASSLKFFRLYFVWSLLAIHSLLITACSDNQTMGEKALAHKIGENMAELQVQTLDGEPQPLKELLATNNAQLPTILNIWATWCTPCLAEMPSLNTLGQSGRARVVAVATDASATVVKDFLRTQNWGQGLEVWYDPNGQVTREALGAKALPSTYVLNPSLTIIYAVVGAKDWANWQPK